MPRAINGSAVLAATALMLFLATALRAPTAAALSIQPGFNGPVNAISQPDANGTRYLGGGFTAFDPWQTGAGALVGSTSGEVNPGFPRVSGGVNPIVRAVEPDGSGGFFIGGLFDCLGPNTTGNCDGADDYPRTNAAHINADGTVASWNPAPNGVVWTIGRSGADIFLGGEFTSVGATPRNRAAAVDVNGTAEAWDPNLNGAVYAIAVSGSTVYVGGDFTQAGGVARSRAASFNSSTGALYDWDPGLNASVNALATSGSTVYLAGGFTTAGGAPRNRAAAFPACSTAPCGGATAWDPNVSSAVSALAISGTDVYLGGNFTSVGGTPRSNIAAVDSSSGNVTSWNPGIPEGGVYSLEATADTIYIGGDFVNVAGHSRANAASVDKSGSLTPWDPSPSAYVMALAVSGESTYLGGYFAAVGGLRRNRAAAVDAGGRLTSWNPGVTGAARGDAVKAVVVEGANVYLGGTFTGIGEQSRTNAGAVSQAGSVTGWAPEPNGEVRALAGSDGIIYLGGVFTSVGPVTRNRAAAVTTAGDLTPWDPDASLYVNAIAVSGNTIYLGGSFSSFGVSTRIRAAAFDLAGTLQSWNPSPQAGPGRQLYAIAAAGGAAYLGGYFGTVGGISRINLAAVTSDPLVAASPPLSWNVGTGLFAASSDAVRSLAVVGDVVYVGGGFSTLGGLSRSRVAAVRAAPAAPTTPTDWNPGANGTVSTIAATADTVYMGGSFSEVAGMPRFYSAAVGADGTLLRRWPEPPLNPGPSPDPTPTPEPGPTPTPEPGPEPGPSPSPTPARTFAVTSTRTAASAVVTRVRVGSAGTINQRATYRTRGRRSRLKTACRTSVQAKRAGTYTVICRLNSAARRELRSRRLRVRVVTEFVPTSGASTSTSRTVTFSRRPAFTG